jgi:hypothetical protein
MRLYSVLLPIWMSRPNTELPQHQGATEESHDVKEITPALGPSDPPTHLVQKAPCPAIKLWGPDQSLSSKAERCYTCTAHTKVHFTSAYLTEGPFVQAMEHTLDVRRGTFSHDTYLKTREKANISLPKH